MVPPFGEGPREVRFQSKASPAAARSIEDVLRAFYERQATSVANQLASMSPESINLSRTMGWWHKDRWVRELREDLMRAAGLPMTDAARQALRELGIDPDELDASAMDRDLDQLCTVRADDIVQSTMEALVRDLSAFDDMTPRSEWTPGAIRSTVRDSYQRLMESRVGRNAESMATALANAGTVNGARQGDPKCMKEWVATGHNTRDSHARLSGERVPIDGRFSNGARWPGDTNLPAWETCYCRCRIEIVKAGEKPLTTLGSGIDDPTEGGRFVLPYLRDDLSFNPDDEEDKAAMLQKCKDEIRAHPVEHALALMPDGSVWEAIGTKDQVKLDGLDLTGVVVVHNHPGAPDRPAWSFSSYDLGILRDHPGMDSLWAVTLQHDYYVRALGEIPMNCYDDAVEHISIEDLLSDPDVHHWKMEVLRDYWGYVDYRRTDV